MKGMSVIFKNRPNDDGTLSTIVIEDCLVYPGGAPSANRPQIAIHIPKASSELVTGAWVNYEGNDYHVIGTEPKRMDDNTPTRWNRYCIAEKIY